VNSISEIFAKSASSKFSAAVSGSASTSGVKKDEKGVSPFAARKTETETVGNRRSVFAAEEVRENETPVKMLSPGIFENAQF